MPESWQVRAVCLRVGCSGGGCRLLAGLSTCSTCRTREPDNADEPVTPCSCIVTVMNHGLRKRRWRGGHPPQALKDVSAPGPAPRSRPAGQPSLPHVRGPVAPFTSPPHGVPLLPGSYGVAVLHRGPSPRPRALWLAVDAPEEGLGTQLSQAGKATGSQTVGRSWAPACSRGDWVGEEATQGFERSVCRQPHVPRMFVPSGTRVRSCSLARRPLE